MCRNAVLHIYLSITDTAGMKDINFNSQYLLFGIRFYCYRTGTGVKMVVIGRYFRDVTGNYCETALSSQRRT